MIRWALLTLAVVVVIFFIVLRFVFVNKNSQQSDLGPSPQEVPLSTQSGQLTKQVNDVLNKSKTPLGADSAAATPNPQQYTALDARIKVLETAIADLRSQMRVIGQNVPAGTTSTASLSKAPIYLPIGAGGASTSPTYIDVYGVEITINPANYPGYTSVTLESSLRISVQGQTAYARLLNVTDNGVVANSEITTQSYQNPAIVNSPNFQLASGSKTYRLQLKSSGNEASSQFARLRINF